MGALDSLATCIERGRTLVADELRAVKQYTRELKVIWDLLSPPSSPSPPPSSSSSRRQQFDELATLNIQSSDPILAHMGRLMRSFAPGLFTGEDDEGLPVDNLELERAFRLPKSHERHIHGHAHAGVRIVQQGPTLIPTLDAHQHRVESFTTMDLLPYVHATVPTVQLESERRRRIMREARSRKSRPVLLARLEKRFQNPELAK